MLMPAARTTFTSSSPWAILVCGWVMLALISTIFSLFSGMPWLLKELDFGYRFALFGHALVSAAVTLTALSLPFILLASLCHRVETLRRFAVALQCCLTALAVIFMVSSYGAYMYSGVYINRSALVMVAHDGRQLLLHAMGFDLALLASLAIILLGVALALLFLVSWTLRDPARVRRLGTSSLLVLLVAAGAAVSGTYLAKRSGVIVQADDTSQTTLAERYRTLERSATGPFSALLSLAAVQQNRPLSSVRSLAQQYTSSAQVDMAQYVRSVKLDDLKRHNVLLILVESLRTDVLQSYGGERAVMPTVDELAKRSERFEHCYAHSSHSNYSDTVPYSSQYPLRGWETHYYPENPNYARVVMHELLQPFGYRTAIVSSQDERWGGMANFFDVQGLNYFFHAGTAPITREGGGNMSEYRQFMLRAQRNGKVDDRETVDALIRWIDKSRDTPFAAYVNLQSSHHPFWVPNGFDKPFKGTPPEDERYLRAYNLYLGYLNSLAYIDSQLARLFSHLIETNRLDDTIVIVSADTAIRFLAVVPEGENSFWEVGNAGRLYEDVVRVPLIAHIPGRPARTRTETCRHIDVLPTIADAIGLPPHPGFQGKSMLAEDYPQDSPVFLVAQTPLAEEYGVIQGGNLFIYDDRARVFRAGELSGAGQRKTLDDIENQRLQALLGTWIIEQISYYENPLQQLTHYPPVPPQ